MSRQNKVNPGRYKMAGRLSPDDLGRERRRQGLAAASGAHERMRQPLPFWQATDPAPPLEVAPPKVVADAVRESRAASPPRRKRKPAKSAKTRTRPVARSAKRSAKGTKAVARKAAARKQTAKKRTANKRTANKRTAKRTATKRTATKRTATKRATATRRHPRASTKTTSRTAQRGKRTRLGAKRAVKR